MLFGENAFLVLNFGNHPMIQRCFVRPGTELSNQSINQSICLYFPQVNRTNPLDRSRKYTETKTDAVLTRNHLTFADFN